MLASIADAGVDYVVVDSFSTRALHYLKPIIEADPDQFFPVYCNGTSTIYKVSR